MEDSELSKYTQENQGTRKLCKKLQWSSRRGFLGFPFTIRNATSIFYMTHQSSDIKSIIRLRLAYFIFWCCIFIIQAYDAKRNDSLISDSNMFWDIWGYRYVWKTHATNNKVESLSKRILIRQLQNIEGTDACSNLSYTYIIYR